MNIHKVRITLDGRSLESLVKEGVLATIETGKYADKVKTPESKIWVITGLKDDQPVAWIQVAKANTDGALSITHEGWIGNRREELTSIIAAPPIKASLESPQEVPDQSRKSLERATVGSFACCTAYGKGCYVTCCNSCCSDPARCPGASCCS